MYIVQCTKIILNLHRAPTSFPGPKHLVFLLEREGDFYRKLVPSSATSASALGVLSVAVCATRAIIGKEKEQLVVNLISSQIGLLSGSLAAGSKKLDTAAHRKMAGVWKMAPESLEMYCSVVKGKMESKDPHVICMAGAIIRSVGIGGVAG
jgi:hypothetical protein